MNYQLFTDTIEKAEKIVIFSHVNPDGDTLGSMLALHNVLREEFSKDSTMVVAGKVPDIYHFLPEIKNVKRAAEIQNENFDTAIAIDIAAKDRMTDGLKIFESAKTTMNIDHHKTNNGYGMVNFINADASSAGEVLFDILKELGIKISQNTAICLYTSILTDTGGFRFENTKAQTLRKAAELVDLGANPASISRFCYESKPKPMVMLQAYCLANAGFAAGEKIAYVTISNEDMKRFNAENDHTEGIVEALRQINTTEVSFVAKEVDEQTTKVSLRSKTIDVSRVAYVFNGGEHTFAAGCTIKKPLVVAKNKLLEEIEKLM